MSDIEVSPRIMFEELFRELSWQRMSAWQKQFVRELRDRWIEDPASITLQEHDYLEVLHNNFVRG